MPVARTSTHFKSGVHNASISRGSHEGYSLLSSSQVLLKTPSKNVEMENPQALSAVYTNISKDPEIKTEIETETGAFISPSAVFKSILKDPGIKTEIKRETKACTLSSTVFRSISKDSNVKTEIGTKTRDCTLPSTVLRSISKDPDIKTDLEIKTKDCISPFTVFESVLNDPKDYHFSLSKVNGNILENGRSSSSPADMSVSKGPEITRISTKPAPLWQKSKVWSKIFNPYFGGDRYKLVEGKSTYTPLWDIVPGCQMFLPSHEELAPESRKEILKHACLDMCLHYVIVLAVDVKGPTEGTVAVALCRSFSKHEEEECRYLGEDWFYETYFYIRQDGESAPPRLEHDIRQLKLYRTPSSRCYNSVRGFVNITKIFTVPYQELQSADYFSTTAWAPSSTFNAWQRRIVQPDFSKLCWAIGFKPEPWQCSGPYMWKDFVKKTGINTFGLDLEDPALYDERAFHSQMWEEGKEAAIQLSGGPDFGSHTGQYSPMGWRYERRAFVGSAQFFYVPA